MTVGTPFERAAADAARKLSARLGALNVLVGADIPERYSRDWSGDHAGAPAMVLRPADTAGVAEAVRVCAAHGVDVIPQGGHTGLVGGATPDTPGQAVLSLERLDRVRGVDAVAMTMEVEAGCILHAAKEAAAAHGCLLPLALGAQGSCQIGGNVATNAGGLNVLRYGMARAMVLGLEVVLADGSVHSDLRALRKNNTGLDLKQLFIGTEGTLGIVTAATLRLQPRPNHVETLWLCADGVADAMALYEAIRREAGELLSAFELMTGPCLPLAAELDPAIPFLGEVEGFAAHVLVEISSSGGPELRSWVEDLVAGLFERGLAQGGLMAQTGAQTDAMWRVRELIVEAQQRRGVHLRTDVSVPISAIAPFTGAATQALEEALPGIEVVAYGHAGDGNMHVVALPPQGMPQQDFAARLDALSACVNDAVDRFGGSISAEHGIGLAKRGALERRLSPVDRRLKLAIKSVLDPQARLSPGRILTAG